MRIQPTSDSIPLQKPSEAQLSASIPQKRKTARDHSSRSTLAQGERRNRACYQFMNKLRAFCSECLGALVECVQGILHSFFYGREEAQAAAFVRKWQSHPIPKASEAGYPEVCAEWEREFRGILPSDDLNGSSAQKYAMRYFTSHSFPLVFEEFIRDLDDQKSSFEEQIRQAIFKRPGDPLVLVALTQWLKASPDERGEERVITVHEFPQFEPALAKAVKEKERAQKESYDQLALAAFKAAPEGERVTAREVVFSRCPHLMPADPNVSLETLDEIAFNVLLDPSFLTLSADAR